MFLNSEKTSVLLKYKGFFVAAGLDLTRNTFMTKMHSKQLGIKKEPKEEKKQWIKVF